MSRMNLQPLFEGCNPTLRSRWGHWWRMTWQQPCDWLLEWNYGLQTPPVVDQEVRDRNSRGGVGGEGQGARSGGQGPKNQGKVQVVESSVAAVDKGGKKKGQQQQQQQGKGQGSGKKPPCYLCQGPHYVKDCPNMKAAAEALKKAQSKN